MRILRNIVVGSVFGGSALIIAFACVDRLDHPAPKASAAPVAALTRIRPPEPTVTGSLPSETGPSISDILGRDAVARQTVTRPPVPKASTTRETATRETTAREAAGRIPAKPVARVAAAPAPKPARKAAEGFDTERLNALMRGDPAVTLARTR
ncbi:hypothetical protein ASF49_17365 [Methylobacterium sp. Leaf104]|uniref:hypothetical protein n=1 Tax=Methylobacterium TaxID=407 RepID=UPI0006F9E8B7|nr:MULTISPECIES: hypothetical protein [Methylobacterium]KQP41531.1 hypothetical protein ASF49_17365 [Methylobacterium sp. Leaf104]MCI9881475.1 hypothetical protein [Methylobacterium goesingense]